MYANYGGVQPDQWSNPLSPWRRKVLKGIEYSCWRGSRHTRQRKRAQQVIWTEGKGNRLMARTFPIQSPDTDIVGQKFNYVALAARTTGDDSEIAYRKAKTSLHKSCRCHVPYQDEQLTPAGRLSDHSKRKQYTREGGLPRKEHVIIKNDGFPLKRTLQQRIQAKRYGQRT